MDTATFHFYDSLNFFLPRRQQEQPVVHAFDWKASIKDMIESLNVPHPEIELLVVNGESVDFDYIVKPDDDIHVYPDFDRVNHISRIRLIPPYPGRPRFVLDTHLGRLAAYLRMMGFDTLYRNDYPDDELAAISQSETRILLTRDIGLLKRSIVTYGYYVRATNPRERLHELTQRYQLADHVAPFKHCMKCNGLLNQVEKADVLSRLPTNIATHYDDFHRCTSCDRIFWKGSHYQKMDHLITEVTQAKQN